MLPFFSFFKSRVMPASCPPALPAGMRAYAIGDIHGRADLLFPLLDHLFKDLQENTCQNAHVIILGDMIDRGPQSRQVIERLIDFSGRSECSVTCLMGNHERMMLDSRVSPVALLGWSRSGGNATLASYGVPLVVGSPDPSMLQPLCKILSDQVPAAHWHFLHTLPLTVRLGDYVFVHAGIQPGLRLEQQKSKSLLWGHGKFLQSTADHGGVIVHGHYITQRPVLHPNRISVDTGAYCHGILSCLRLEGNQASLIQSIDGSIHNSPVPVAD